MSSIDQRPVPRWAQAGSSPTRPRQFSVTESFVALPPQEKGASCLQDLKSNPIYPAKPSKPSRGPVPNAGLQWFWLASSLPNRSSICEPSNARSATTPINISSSMEQPHPGRCTFERDPFQSPRFGSPRSGCARGSCCHVRRPGSDRRTQESGPTPCSCRHEAAPSIRDDAHCRPVSPIEKNRPTEGTCTVAARSTYATKADFPDQTVEEFR